jgi:hypothetical protein
MEINMSEKIKINRAPVLTLWAAVVSERLGYSRDESLTLAKAVAGLNAQSKGRRLGIYKKTPEEEKTEKRRQTQPKEAVSVEVLGRPVPAVHTQDGLRAVNGDNPISPQSVERYLQARFGNSLPLIRRAFEELAASYSPEELKHHAYSLYESFRPTIPEGKKSWGAQGELVLAALEKLKKG